MKIVRLIAFSLVFSLLVSCSDKNKELLKVIPGDAVGVASIDLPGIMKKSGMINDDDQFKMPPELQKIVDDNDASGLCQMLNDLPVMGLDPECKVYTFFTLKTFASVTLFALDKEENARKVIERRTGKDFAKVNDLDCISVGDDFYAISDGILFKGRVNVSQEEKKLAAAAAKMLGRNAASIVDKPSVMEVIDAENDVNAYLHLDAIKNMSRRSKTYRELSQKMPLVDIFVESDIDSYVASLNFNDATADLDVKIKVDNNSDYISLLDRTLCAPGAEFLKAIPESMEYIMAMSVKGGNFVKLPQMSKMIAAFKKVPMMGRLDIESMLTSIDGPVAAGMAYDENLDDWNTVIVARSTDPDAVLNTVSRFALTVGQKPEIYDGEYIYEYENKMIKLGVVDGIVYMKMLNYEQTEGYAYDNKALRDFFAKSPIGLYVRAKDAKSGGSISIGLQDKTTIKGTFKPSVKGANTVVAFLQTMCSIKPAKDYEDDSEMTELVLGAIDELQPVN